MSLKFSKKTLLTVYATPVVIFSGNIGRSVFSLIEDPSQIFTDYSQRDKLDSA